MGQVTGGWRLGFVVSSVIYGALWLRGSAEGAAVQEGRYWEAPSGLSSAGAGSRCGAGAQMSFVQHAQNLQGEEGA